MADSSLLEQTNCTYESIDQSASYIKNSGVFDESCYLMNISCTLIVAPSGVRPFVHGRVAALEKGATIPCELRLAVHKL